MDTERTHVAFGPAGAPLYESGWTGDYIKAYLLSDVGKKREKNEDSCILVAPSNGDILARRGILFAVADGMGGAVAGEYASRLALDLLAEAYYALTERSVPQALEQAVARANESVFHASESNPVYSGMGTTLSALVILGNHGYIAQVGDSRIYLYRENVGVQQLTQDHSLVAEQVRIGLLQEADARNHSLKNLITRAVGIKQTVRVDLFSVRLEHHDTLLLCSDGLSNFVTDEEIALHLAGRNVQQSARTLVDIALQQGGIDNITAVVVHLFAPPPSTRLQPGAEYIELAGAHWWQRLSRYFQR